MAVNPADAPQFGATISVLRIFDQDKAREFYLDFLGFTKDWEHRFGENFPIYMQVSKGTCVIHLTEHHGDACPGGAVRIGCTDVKQFSEILRGKDYKYAKPGCRETEWKTIEMSIKDPFGNTLTFAQRVNEDQKE
jgi:hypothetical protein